jgi:hypothetical protein
MVDDNKVSASHGTGTLPVTVALPLSVIGALVALLVIRLFRGAPKGR